MNKLSEGRGNLIGQIEGFRALGVEVKRPINPLLAQQAGAQHDEAEEANDDDVAALPQTKDGDDTAGEPGLRFARLRPWRGGVFPCFWYTHPHKID